MVRGKDSGFRLRNGVCGMSIDNYRQDGESFSFTTQLYPVSVANAMDYLEHAVFIAEIKATCFNGSVSPIGVLTLTAEKKDTYQRSNSKRGHSPLNS